MPISSRIRYLRECYREDAVRGGYWDIHAKGVEHRIVFDGREQAIDDVIPNLVIPPAHDAQPIMRDVTVKRAEKEFLYGSLFVAGRLQSNDDGALRKVCSPLVLIPLRVDPDDSSGLLQLDFSARRLNSSLIDRLGDSAIGGDVADLLAREYDAVGLSEGAVMRAEAFLREHFPGLDLTPMVDYPQLLDERAFKQRVREAQSKSGAGLCLLPASVAALWPKSDAARGIIAELDAMAGGEHFSPGLRALLGTSVIAMRQRTAPNMSVPPVPAILSGAQKEILASARAHPLTLAHGPPGTGKSFTIAAVALDHLSRSESVLILSKADHAIDVVADQIEREFGVKGCVVRAGKAGYLTQLKTSLENVLAGVGIGGGTKKDGLSALRQFNRNAAEIEKLQQAIARARTRELDDGKALSDEGGGIVRTLRRWFAKRRSLRSELPNVAIEQLQDDLDKHVAGARIVLQQLREDGVIDCLRRSRPELQRFLKALKSRRGARKQELFAETTFGGILDAFPIWITKLADVHRVLPLRSELFDLVIIDEATQCDIPGCLPALQRAKRVLIAGDARQLRHLSFLSRDRQRRLASEFEIDPEADFANYRETSILDLAAARVADQDRVGFLNEHYRSCPELIAFSNRKFYQGALSVMSEGRSGRGGRVLHLHSSPAEREKSGVNPSEVKQVIAMLRDIATAQRGVAAEQCTTIGVLSPLRAQVEALQEAVARNFESELFNRLNHVHQLRIATAYGFQGAERDVMLLSLAAGSSDPHATLRFLARPDVLNVAITRAREEQHVFCSFDIQSLPADSLLGEYLGFVADGRGGHQDSEEELPADGFAQQVSGFLESLGCQVECGKTIAGERFDLCATRGERMVGIDLIGYPGLFEESFPIERYKMFRRAGVSVLPVAYTAWLLRRNETELQLRQEILKD